MSDSATHSTSRITQICHCLEADQEEQPARLVPPQGQRTRLPEEQGWKRMQAKALRVAPAPVTLTIRLGTRPPREVCLTIPRKRDRYALLFGIQLTDVDRAGSHMLPHYAWNETIIKDILGTEVQEISDVIVLSPVECMVYSGQRSRGQGFTQAEATEIARQLHDSHTMWIGCRVRMRCIPRTLRDAKVDLKSTKEYIRECTYGKLGTRSPTRRSGNREAHWQAVLPWDASRERGMVRCSDRYLADQYLRRERREGRAHAAWPQESDPQDTTTAWVQHYAEAPEARIGVGRRGLTAGGQELDMDTPWVEEDRKTCHNQPGDAFHSTQEDQWDSPPEFLSDDSDEESDDIVAYDTTMSRYTTRTEQDQKRKKRQPQKAS